jgi:competence protein ComEA
MPEDKLSRFWLLVTGILILIIIGSSITIGLRHDNGQPIQIIPPDEVQFEGLIYVEGSVISPGTYPFQSGDTFGSLIQASGGTDSNADFSRIQLYIPGLDSNQQSQKIDINRADSWLLQALPGIGEVRALAIIDYRQQNGHFHCIEDITNVSEINESTFEKIRPLITVAEY